MKDLLVGSTGFVGSNLAASHEFDSVCHSTDISNYFGSTPDYCVYAGIPAAMYLANNFPLEDLKIIESARDNIRRINPHKLILISTVAVYPFTNGVDESTPIETTYLPAYGKNRYMLEQWVREDYPSATIIRLPALYGKGLKKNFLFDLHMIIPFMLNKEKYVSLSANNSLIKDNYTLRHDGFYVLKEDSDRQSLRTFFMNNDFNALSFTDSRSKYQFYNLDRLWDDIKIAVSNEIPTLNISTPPISAQEVYEYVTGKNDWYNELRNSPMMYNSRSLYADLFGGKDGYFITKQFELEDIKKFLIEWS